MGKSKVSMRGFVKPLDVVPVEALPPEAWLVNRLQEDDNGQPLMEGIFSNYNDDIVLEMDPNTLVGRYDSARGPAQRLEIGPGLRVEDGVLIGEGGGGGGEQGPPGPPGPEGPPGPQGDSGASSSVFQYRVDAQSQAATDPGAGKLRYNNANQSLATRLYFDRLTVEGYDALLMFKTAHMDDEFVIQRTDLSTTYQVWRLLGPGIDRTDWFEVAVEFVRWGGPGGVGAFANNTNVFALIRTRGEPGAQGPAGPVGPTGPQGSMGLTGPQGVPGPTGPVGPAGPKGSTGDTGPQGVAGPKGDTGSQGPVGVTGAPGPKGDKGDIGATGNTGPQGNQGDTGPQGERGPAGISTTEIGETPPAVPTDGMLWWSNANGQMFIWYDDGTSAQWVSATVRGAKGEDSTVPGPQGPTGPQGPAGPAGELSIATADARYVNVTGDTLSGDLAINKASPALILDNTGTTNSLIYGRRGGKDRWIAVLGEATAEGGANAGSDFSIYRCADSGTMIDTALRISRATGQATLAGHVVPATTGTQNLGSATARWGTVYTSDLDLNNGIGDWTIVEGEDDLFLYNNKKGKVYKFALTEVDPATATPKRG